MKFKIVCLLLNFICYFGISQAQTGLERYRKAAEKLTAETKYEDAIEIYERILYFTKDKSAEIIYLPLARLYSVTENYEKASLLYNEAYSLEKVDSIKNDIAFETSMNYLQAGDFNLAYEALSRVSEKSTDVNTQNKLHLLTGTLDFKSGKYSEAKQHFLAINELSPSSQKSIEDLFHKTNKINRRYNPEMVKWMSIVPGLGQTWCGQYKDGINSFVLNGALTFLFVYVSSSYTLLDGFLVVSPWLNRYYRGGIMKTYKIGVKKREVERNKIYNSILKSLPTIK